jgi:hypothetical protein
MREIRRRTRVVGNFPDGQAAVMLVAARLRHVAGSKWGTRRYLDMERLGLSVPIPPPEAAAAVGWIVTIFPPSPPRGGGRTSPATQETFLKRNVRILTDATRGEGGPSCYAGDFPKSNVRTLTDSTCAKLVKWKRH